MSVNVGPCMVRTGSECVRRGGEEEEEEEVKEIQECFYMRMHENSVGGCEWDVMPATYPHRDHTEPRQSVRNRKFDEERTSEL